MADPGLICSWSSLFTAWGSCVESRQAGTQLKSYSGSQAQAETQQETNTCSESGYMLHTQRECPTASFVNYETTAGPVGARMQAHPPLAEQNTATTAKPGGVCWVFVGLSHCLGMKSIFVSWHPCLALSCWLCKLSPLTPSNPLCVQCSKSLLNSCLCPVPPPLPQGAVIALLSGTP